MVFDMQRDATAHTVTEGLPEKGAVSHAARSFSLADGFSRDEAEENRTIEFSISSETPVDRWWGTEVLEHTDKAVDLGFANSGTAPLLLNHDRRQQIGVIEEVWRDKKKLRARVRFSRGSLGQEILDDILDGIRGNVSVGYHIHETVVNEKKDTVRVTQWSPYEASIVAIPADPKVGVGRAQQEEIVMPDKVDDKDKNAPASAAEQRGGDGGTQTPLASTTMHLPGQKNELREVTFTETEMNERQQQIAADRNLEVSEIMSLAAIHNMSDAAREFIRDGKSLAEFTGHVRENIDGDKPLRNEDIGLTQAETERFSIIRMSRAYAPRATATELEAAAFEIEAVRAAMEADTSGRVPNGVLLPTEVMRDWVVPGTQLHADMARARDVRMHQRDLSVTNDGDLVPQDYRAGSFIDVLRSLSGPMRAGATMLQGLSGDVDIPKKLTASAPAWISAEGGNAAESEPTFGLVSLRPKDIAVHTDMTRRMRQQASPDIENLVRMDIAAGMVLGIDLAALEGAGSGGVPEGVLNTTGVGKPTAFAGVNPTFAEVVALETAVADDNALMGSLNYIGRTNMRGALKTTTKDAGSGRFVFERGEVNDYPYLVSNQITDGNLYFGNWSDLLVGMWGTLDLQLDYAALALSGGLRMIAFQTVDTAVRHAQSFSYNNDT